MVFSAQRSVGGLISLAAIHLAFQCRGNRTQCEWSFLLDNHGVDEIVNLIVWVWQAMLFIPVWSIRLDCVHCSGDDTITLENRPGGSD